MSVRLMGKVWDSEYAKYQTDENGQIALNKKGTPVESKAKLLVMLKLADNANDEGLCYPKQDTIAEKTTVKRPTVSKIINQLEADRKIVKTRTKEHNIYKLNFEDLDSHLYGNPPVENSDSNVSSDDIPNVSSADIKAVQMSAQMTSNVSSADIPLKGLNHQKNRQYIEPSSSKDDGELWKTDESIVQIYAAYQQFFHKKIRWRKNDDAEGKNYNDVDLRLIELGIIQTQIQATFEKINSFKYYTSEIDRFVDIGEQMDSATIDVMLSQNRKHWLESNPFGVGKMGYQWNQLEDWGSEEAA